MRKLVIISGFILLLQSSNAVSQDLDLPDLTNYQHNWMVYNPAFTGSREVASTSVFYRQIDFTLPAPVYGQVSWHSPMKNNKVALGISYFNESNPGSLFNTISVSSRQVKDNLYLNYAFRVQAGGGRIAFGISAGATMYTTKLEPNVLHPGDSYLYRDDMEIIPNVGAGVLYYNKDYFFGISVPKFLSRGEHLNEITHDFRSYTGVFTGGYEFNISENFTVSPTAMVLYKLNQPVNVQGGLNFGFFSEKVWLGGVYKRPDFIAALFNIEITPQIMLGYAFSYSLNLTNSYYSQTHEIVLRHELRKIVPSKIPFYY